jgi:hypothetical protein
MTNTELFGRRASECRRLAATARDSNDKEFWWELAERWRAIESRWEAIESRRARTRRPRQRASDARALAGGCA